MTARPSLIAGEPLELRLLVPAAAAWLTAGLVLWLPVGAGLLGGAAFGASGVVTALVARQDRRRARVRVLAAALMCAAGAATAAAWRVGAVQRGPLPALARSHSSATLVLIVTNDPHLSSGSGFSQNLVVLSARAVAVTTPEGSVAISSPIVVLTTASGWLTLQPTQRVTAAGRLSVPMPGELVTAVFDARGSPTSIGAPSLPEVVAGRVRSGLRAAVAPLSSGPRGLLPGLVEGDTSGLSPDLVAAFRTTGLTHIVAVSGANVAIVLGAALAVARQLGAGRRTQALIGVLTIVGFVVVARPQASVLRAAAMGLVAVLALATGRRRRALPALCAAVLCLIYVDPTLSRSVGFALSVVATGALLLLAPPLRARMARRLPGWLADALAVPTAATIACAPLIASISGQVSLASIPANLLAEPAVAPATILGVITAGLAQVSLGAAQLVARVAGIPCWWLVFVARTFARLPGAAIPWPSGTRGSLSLVAVLGVGAALVELRRLGRPPRLLRAVVPLMAIVSVVAAGFVVHERLSPHAWPPSSWAMAVCDVGQGEAIVARSGAQSAVLFDTGPAPPALDQCLVALGVHSLSSIVLTGGSSSAISGMPGALHARVVGAIDSDAEVADDAEVRVRGWALATHAMVSTAVVGQVHVVGDVRWRVLAEFASARLVSIELPGLTALVGGDLDAADEAEAVSQVHPLSANVLIVPHHGADTQDVDFLKAVHPSVAVVSVGRGNSQRDPAVTVMKTLSDIVGTAGQVVRTDRDGDIAITVNSRGPRVAPRH
ncbi:MAG TPA: ComEC/Rec2 family competence protein [Acidothermaceae bacterium]|nr:ComEC/Rec2 family competence protein [Acidothermaceae bacterium]